jgi:trk system potassium uptake protein
MYVVIVGAGKVGWNLARELINKRHEVTVIEADQHRYAVVEQELEHSAMYGDGSELWVLERSGIERADLVVAVTGDDEDNIVVCQVARERYGVERVIARVNDPRNHELFDLLGIAPSVCATTSIMRLIEHELPDHELVPLLELRREGLEVVEVQLGDDIAQRRVSEIPLPEGARLIAVLRAGASDIAGPETIVRPGDQVLAIARSGLEDALRRALLT